MFVPTYLNIRQQGECRLPDNCQGILGNGWRGTSIERKLSLIHQCPIANEGNQNRECSRCPNPKFAYKFRGPGTDDEPYGRDSQEAWTNRHPEADANGKFPSEVPEGKCKADRSKSKLPPL